MSLNSKIKQTLRSKILKKRGNLCCFCRKPMKKPEMTLEHFISLADGGTNALSNLTLSCSKCSKERDHKDFEKFRAIKMKERGEDV